MTNPPNRTWCLETRPDLEQALVYSLSVQSTHVTPLCAFIISYFLFFCVQQWPAPWLLHLICCRWGTRGFGGVKYACEALTHVRVPCAEMCDEIRFVQKRVVARETVLRTGGPATLCVQTRDVQKNKVLLCSERQSHLPFKILHALLIYFKSFWSGTGKDYWKS